MKILFIIFILFVLAGCVTIKPKTLNLVPSDIYLEAHTSDPYLPPPYKTHIDGVTLGINWHLDERRKK